MFERKDWGVTERGDFKNTFCADCGRAGTTVRHKGPLVPGGWLSYFCDLCWRDRVVFFDYYEAPKPIPGRPAPAASQRA